MAAFTSSEIVPLPFRLSISVEKRPGGFCAVCVRSGIPVSGDETTDRGTRGATEARGKLRATLWPRARTGSRPRPMTAVGLRNPTAGTAAQARDKII
jgi:hypothetical protein